MKDRRKSPGGYLPNKNREFTWQKLPNANKTGPSFTEKNRTCSLWGSSRNTSNLQKQQESFVSGCWIYRSFKAVLPRVFRFLKEPGICGHTFHTKGCHGKAYYPWKCPCLKRETSYPDLLKLKGVYIRQWQEILRKRVSGSSAKSGSSTDSGDTFYKFSWRFDEDFLSLPKQRIWTRSYSYL